MNAVWGGGGRCKCRSAGEGRTPEILRSLLESRGFEVGPLLRKRLGLSRDSPCKSRPARRASPTPEINSAWDVGTWRRPNLTRTKRRGGLRRWPVKERFYDHPDPQPLVVVQKRIGPGGVGLGGAIRTRNHYYWNSRVQLAERPHHGGPVHPRRAMDNDCRQFLQFDRGERLGGVAALKPHKPGKFPFQGVCQQKPTVGVIVDKEKFGRKGCHSEALARGRATIR